MNSSNWCLWWFSGQVSLCVNSLRIGFPFLGSIVFLCIFPTGFSKPGICVMSLLQYLEACVWCNGIWIPHSSRRRSVPLKSLLIVNYCIWSVGFPWWPVPPSSLLVSLVFFEPFAEVLFIQLSGSFLRELFHMQFLICWVCLCEEVSSGSSCTVILNPPDFTFWPKSLILKYRNTNCHWGIH